MDIGLSNNIIIENQKYDDYGIEFEAYDKDLYDNHVDVHIMGNNIRRNYGLYYNDTSMEAVDRRDRNIGFLAHPKHWYYNVKHWM